MNHVWRCIKVHPWFRSSSYTASCESWDSASVGACQSSIDSDVAARSRDRWIIASRRVRMIRYQKQGCRSHHSGYSVTAPPGFPGRMNGTAVSLKSAPVPLQEWLSCPNPKNYIFENIPRSLTKGADLIHVEPYSGILHTSVAPVF